MDNDDVCACCGDKFSKQGGRTRRTNIFTKWKGGLSAAESLQKTCGTSITPERVALLCMSCRQAIRSVSVKQEQLHEAEEKFRKVRVSGSYIAKKVATTPSHRKSPHKKKIISTKVHSPFTKLPSRTSTGEDGKLCITVNDTVIGRAVQQIACSKYRAGFKQLIEKSNVARHSMISVVCNLVRKEMMSFVEKTRCDRSEISMLNFHWKNTMETAKSVCPATEAMITASLTRKRCQKTATKKIGKRVVSLAPVISSILLILAFVRNNRCSIFQEIVSVLLWLSGCKRKVFKSLNKLGWCQSNTTTQRRVDALRKDFDATVKRWKSMLSDVEKGTTYQEPTKSPEETEDSLLELEEVWEDLDADIPTDTDESLSDSDELSSQLASCSISTSDPPGTDNEAISCESLISETETIGAATEPSRKSFQCLYYDVTFDNVNQKTSVRHHVRGKKNNILNLVQAYATKERIGSYGMSNRVPTSEDLKKIRVSDFLPSAEDEMLLKKELCCMVSRTLTTHVPFFQGLDTEWSIPHEYSYESGLKSEIVPLGVLNKDESKTADTIDILEDYSQYVAKDADGNPLSILLHCDGLSCERVHGAKRARINGENAWSRLEMFEPCIQEWHRRLMYIQDTYDELFKFESHREKGTLYNLKQIYNHSGVSSNVMNCFDKAEELLEFVTEGYTVLFAMELMGIESMTDEPADFPITQPDKVEYRDHIANNIIEEIFYQTNTADVVNVAVDSDVELGDFCICKLEMGGPMIYCCNTLCSNGQWFHFECLGIDEDDIPDGDWYCSGDCKEQIGLSKKRKPKTVQKFRDLKRQYIRRLLWRGLNAMARHDAVRENDGLRMIRHWKFDMFEFQEKNHPKYFIFAHRLLANVSGAASERVAHQMIWERTVNLRGIKGHNIPKDLHCEHLNKEYKDSSKASGGQLTEETVKRHSQMLGIGKMVGKLFEGSVVGSTPSYTRRHGAVDRTNDILRMVRTLKKENFFTVQIGRSFKGFEDFSALGGVRSPAKLKQKILKHLQNMIDFREVSTLQ